MFEEQIHKEKLDHIVAFLSNIDLFKKLKKSAIKDLASSMTFVSLGGGEVIIRQGELDATLYILYHGRLRVFVKPEGPQSSQETTFIAEISAGQIVGEIAFLTNRPRTGTVRAIRDSLLLKLDKERFKQFEKYHPEEVIEMAKTALKRLANKPRPTTAGENIVSIAIAPAGDSDHRFFIRRFADELNKIKPTLLVNPELCNKHFGKNIAQTQLLESDHSKIIAWLQSLEDQYGYIVYETDRQMTPWTHRCLRQADRLLFVAEENIHPALNSIELTLFSDSSENLIYNEIVILHPDGKEISGTNEWLKIRRVSGHHHLRIPEEEDWARLVRFLTGRAFGVVLNGGGARGYAHLGVLKALHELNIPVDFVGGTSMGAIIGAVYARFGLKKAVSLGRYFSDNFRNDYTFPFIALLKGKFITHFYKKTFEDVCIEDTSTPFFCVSTNLTKGKLEIHDQGPLWFAIRASTSIPAVFPPIYDINGDMLIDGGVINNMPVDIMRNKMTGGKILAVNCTWNVGEHRGIVLKDPWISGWKLFFQNLNPFNREKGKYDTIYGILFASMKLGSDDQQRRMEKEADYFIQFDTSKYGILEFNEEKTIVDIGYRGAMETLPKLLFPNE